MTSWWGGSNDVVAELLGKVAAEPLGKFAWRAGTAAGRATFNE